jgi:hypothetical protein
MRCEDCGIPMNRHAEKPLKFLPAEEYPNFDSILGGVVASIHCCPGCGKVEAETGARE